MLMTFSYKEESWAGIEPEELVWPAGLGFGDRATAGEPEQQPKGSWRSKLYFKAQIHPRRAGMGTAPWDTAFPEGLWDEGQKCGHSQG